MANSFDRLAPEAACGRPLLSGSSNLALPSVAQHIAARPDCLNQFLTHPKHRDLFAYLAIALIRTTNSRSRSAICGRFSLRKFLKSETLRDA